MCPTSTLPARQAEAPVEFDPRGVIERESPVPYYYQLARYIEEQIKAGKWLPGQLLPSEQQICEQLDVSRTVVRQAMTNLSNDGLIVKQNGKRSSVASRKYTEGLMQDLRGFHADALAEGQVPSTRVLSIGTIPAEGEVASALGLEEGKRVVAIKRLRFLNGEPAVVVDTYLPASLCPGLVDEDLNNRSLYDVLEARYGLTVAEGYRTIEAVSAGPEEARLLGVRKGSPLLLLKSVGLLPSGTPLEYFVALHRADLTRFKVRLVRTTGNAATAPAPER